MLLYVSVQVQEACVQTVTSECLQTEASTQQGACVCVVLLIQRVCQRKFVNPVTTVDYWNVCKVKSSRVNATLCNQDHHTITRNHITHPPGWSAWLSGRTSVSGQCSFTILRSTCS